MMELAMYSAALFTKLWEFALTKFLTSLVLTLGFFLFDGNHTHLYWALLALICMDTVSGIGGAYRSGEVIESAKIIRVPYKVLFYFMMISAGFLVEKFISMDLGMFGIDETILVFLAITEFTSIVENIGKMGYETPKKLLNNVRRLR